VSSVRREPAGGSTWPSVSRLPSLSELVAYVLQEGIQVTGQTWSSDVADISGGEEHILTSDESSRETKSSTISLGYRCLFYRTNSG
jgi:hypothetical protein